MYIKSSLIYHAIFSGAPPVTMKSNNIELQQLNLDFI